MTRNEMYLDYVNNFLTVARFAEYYNMTEEEAREFIEYEREQHNHNAAMKATSAAFYNI